MCNNLASQVLVSISAILITSNAAFEMFYETSTAYTAKRIPVMYNEILRVAFNANRSTILWSLDVCSMQTEPI